MPNFKKEIIKKNIFFGLYIIFFVLNILGAVLCIIGQVSNAGYAVIPMLGTLIFSSICRNYKKIIEEKEASSKKKNSENKNI